MSRILGIDVGTNSLGLVVRDENVSSNPSEQIVFSSVNLFDSGVGNGQSGEFSFAAERTKSRSQRHLYKVRRYRKWKTLKLLISDDKLKYCPISQKDLERWTTYDKRRGLKREYPIDSIEFQQWIRMDFNGDGIPDYSSPYELRNDLATKQLDFDDEINRFKLGRAIYHIAERRGFKSSKGEKIKNADVEHEEDATLKESEIERAFVFDTSVYPTVGCALYARNKLGGRVRNECSVIRKQYKDELEYIFNFQQGLNKESDLFKSLISEKKKDGTIFYKMPLKSQKGNVGKCTLEPNKPRCPESRPEFEEFRALSFINSIRFGTECKRELSTDEKKCLFKDVFLRATDFKFSKIREWIEIRTREHYSYSTDSSHRTINYKDNTPVIACTVTYRFMQLLGESWNTWALQSADKFHTNHKDNSNSHQTTYTWEDVWHVCFGADDEEPIALFAQKAMLDKGALIKLWKSMPISYANLSLKAINNINRFLRKGMLYNEACMLAKLPDIFKERWTTDVENVIVASLTSVMSECKEQRNIVNIVNSLVAHYKSLPDDEKHAYKNFEYIITNDDVEDIRVAAKKYYGERTWDKMSEDEKVATINDASELYQGFFSDEKRDYIKLPRIEDALKQFLSDNFDFLDAKSLSKLYHHSQIEYYRPASIRRVERDGKIFDLRLLENPAINALRNPMALRVLHTLRRKVNDLLKEGIISEDDTRVVVEVARELNDANMRWAIKHYQDVHNAENDEIRKILAKDLASQEETRMVRMLVEQHDCDGNGNRENDKERREMYYERYMNELIKKYRLWVEQGGFCIYTRKPITMSSIFNGNKFNIEHTIPRSLSFDDSLSNETLCDAEFNQKIKNKRIPSELDNYEEILQNIQPWMDKVEDIRSRITFWKNKSKKAQTKEQKDNAIRQRRLWELHLDYWQKKVNGFLAKDVTPKFRNSQLVDTSIIAKYTMHFLKTVFTRVDVQKGKITSDFRKVLGIQDDDTLKVRDSNSHHAIDAMVLTFIPVAVRRDEILEKFYERKELKDLGHDVSHIDKEIKLLLKKCGIGFGFEEIINQIKTSVLAFYERKNQALTIAKRRKRIRGKVVAQRNDKGEIIFETNENGDFRLDKYGHRIPLAQHWLKGDSIRGDLHDKTYYGAITQYGSDEVKYVLRRELKYKASSQDTGFKTWEELESVIVNKSLIEMMKGQFPEGTTFKDACVQGIYMLDHYGNKKNRIRHIRCYTPSVTNPIQVREQTYKSKKEYKNYYYSRNGENIAYALYSNGNKTTFECLSLFDAAKISKTEGGIHDIRSVFSETKMHGKVLCEKVFTLLPGQMVILRQEDETIGELTQEELSCRLYRMKRIYHPGDGRLQLQHHLETRDDKALLSAYPREIYGKNGVNGFSQIDYTNPLPRLLLSPGKQKFWVEGQDFIIRNGRIVAKP